MDGKAASSVLLFLLCLLSSQCHGNQYDPHLYPKHGPFFEGWYVRLMDLAQNVSLGFLFGRVLPSSSSGTVNCTESLPAAESQKWEHPSDFCPMKHHQHNPLVLASILVQDRNTSQRLQSFNGAFAAKDYSVLVKGKSVVSNPDDKSPPSFSVTFGNNGSFIVTPNQTFVDVTIGNVGLAIQASDPVPWGPHGEGPEGWLEYLPLPLHWFVYSLRSTVLQYKFSDSVSGRTISETKARLHMEKNWGKSFPAAWIWLQGLTETNITLAMSGGIVDFEVVNVTAFLVGYRNPAKKIVWNFTPANSIASFVHNGCEGYVHLNLTNLEHRLVVKIFSPAPYFSECLLGPEREGFRSACVESYDAVASVRAYEWDYIRFNFKEIDCVDIYGAALEFGGKYVCKDKCSAV